MRNLALLEGHLQGPAASRRASRRFIAVLAMLLLLLLVGAATLAVVPSIPVAGLALILGVDRFMSEARSLTNFVGNGSRPSCTNTALLGCSFDDQEVWSAMFRWQRNFYP